MWPDRRLIDLLDIEHPIVLAPMAGFCTTRLAAEVCAGGALGSIGCGVMSPEAAATTIRELRGLTDRPINVNFFCHAPANAMDNDKQAWRNRLLAYYRELDIAADPAVNAAGLSPFNADMCAVVEATRPEVVSFHFGLPAQSLLGKGKGGGVPRHVVGNHCRGGKVARGAWRRCHHCTGMRGGRASRHLPCR